jgi:outer membrane lipoprotein LolB
VKFIGPFTLIKVHICNVGRYSVSVNRQILRAALLRRITLALQSDLRFGGYSLSVNRPFILIVPLLLLLNACAVYQSPLQDIDEQLDARTQALWEAHRVQVSAIDNWKIKGKIAVKAGKKGGHATLLWNREDARQHIELFGPLGGGRVVMDVDAQGARLQDTKGADIRGESLTVLVEKRLGWPLPLDSLPYWLRGLPTSEEANMEWDVQGQLERINDSGWQVSFLEYQSVSLLGKAIFLPRQIELNALPGTLRVYDKKGEFLGEDFFIRLIIKSWLP